NHAAWEWEGAGDDWLARDEAGQLRGLDQFLGMAPPVALTFWSFRLAALAGLGMALVATATLWWGRRKGYDPGAFSRRWQHVLVACTFSGWLLLLAGMAHVLLGAFPYAVTGTITVSE